ncbi:Nmad5 family putative nucleotide modification protein [Escherichia coli]|uniref:Nmad5 family putative nucleotide modification protein n=1 Tax=Escherichia coli TaxID=562 RepID=UPI00396476AE
MMLPSETMIWQPEFTDKTLSRKPGAVQTEEVDQLASKLMAASEELQKLGCSFYSCDVSSCSIYLTVSGRRVGWHSYGKDGNGEDILLPTPDKDKCMFDAEHKITKRFDEICALQQKLEARKKDIESNVWAALNSVTTVKRLIEVWPESKELLPKEADKASAALPALRVEDLNKMIGLPSEAA